MSCSTDRTREEKVAAIINKVNDPFLVINALPDALIEKSGALDGALPFTYEMLFSFFIDEDVTGVDYDTDVQIIVSKGPSFAPNFYGVFKVKNETAFIELLETEANAKIEEKDGFKYIVKETDQFVIAWNDDIAIASNIPLDMEAMFSGGTSGGGIKAVNKNIDLIKAASEGESSEEYLEFFKNDADVAFHFSGDGFYAYLEEMSMGNTEEIEKMKESLEGTKFDLLLSFNDGSIDFSMVTDRNEELKEKMTFVKDGGVDNSLLGYGNSENPVITMAFNSDLEKGLTYFEEQMGEYEYEQFTSNLSDVGLTTEDAKGALDGGIVAIVDRIEMVETVYDYGYGEPYVSSEPAPVFALILDVKDQSIVEKALLEGIKNELGEELAPEVASALFGGVVPLGDAFVVLKDGVLFSSSDSLWAAKVVNGTTVNVANKNEIITKNSFGFFADFAGLAEMEGMQDAKMVVDLITDITASGNMEEMNIAINFLDKSKNALRVLTETIANFANEGVQQGQDDLEAELEEAVSEEAEYEAADYVVEGE